VVATFSSSKHLEKNEDSSTVNLVSIGETAHTHKLNPELKVIKFCGHNSAILQLSQVVKAAQGADSVPLSQPTSSVLKGIAGIFISEKTETLNKLTDKKLLDIYTRKESNELILRGKVDRILVILSTFATFSSSSFPSSQGIQGLCIEWQVLCCMSPRLLHRFVLSPRFFFRLAVHDFLRRTAEQR
jgi:hypothetical protein